LSCKSAVRIVFGQSGGRDNAVREYAPHLPFASVMEVADTRGPQAPAIPGSNPGRGTKGCGARCDMSIEIEIDFGSDDVATSPKPAAGEFDPDRNLEDWATLQLSKPVQSYKQYAIELASRHTGEPTLAANCLPRVERDEAFGGYVKPLKAPAFMRPIREICTRLPDDANGNNVWVPRADMDRNEIDDDLKDLVF